MAASLPDPRSPRPGRAGRLRLAAPALFLLLLAPLPVLGQERASPRLRGRVLGADSAAVSGAVVVLHMVAPDTAGEVDSVRTGSTGDFTFELPTLPDPVARGEVYFAAVTHQGILYFGPPLRLAEQLDSTYHVFVHDTVMAPAGGAALPLALRYLILDPAPDGWVVTDVFQIENEGRRTLVAPEGKPVWTYPLPAGSTDLEAGGGDVSAESIGMENGALQVSAPLPPGVRQFMVRYRLTQPRLQLHLPGLVHQLELLVREPAPELAVEGLMLNAPADLDGATYRRYSAAEVRDQSVVVTPGRIREGFRIRWLAVILALVLTAVSLWAYQRGASVSTAGGETVGAATTSRERRERLLLDVALLDERLADAGVGPEELERTAARRRRLVEEIRGLG